MTVLHQIKVAAPYMDALLAGRKPFEVRRNDRGYQTGDVLELVEYLEQPIGKGQYREPRTMRAEITYVYSGDPRFDGHGGLQPGYVVLGITTR